MRGDTVAIRDRLLAALRAADRPLTTTEVCDLAGPYLETRRHQPWMHDGWPHPYVTLVSCDGESEVVSCHLSCGQRGYQQLRWLEGRGFVKRLRTEGTQSVRWLALSGQVADQLSELEQMWAAS